MAAATVTTTTTTSSPSTLAILESQPLSATFLGRCVEALRPENLNNKIADCEQRAYWCNVAATACLVAYVALAACAFIAAGVFAPIYAPIVGFVAIAMAPSCFFFTEKLYDTEAQAKNEALGYTALRTHYETLGNTAPEALQEIFLRYVPGVQPEQMTGLNLPALNPLLAHAMHLEQMLAQAKGTRDPTTGNILPEGSIEADIAKANRLEDEANRLEQGPAQSGESAETDTTRGANPPQSITEEAAQPNWQQINMYRMRALKSKDNYLLLKVQAAFINAVMRKPDTTGSVEDLVIISPLSSLDRLLRNGVNGIDNGFLRLETAASHIEEIITVDEVYEQSTAALGLRFFRTMQESAASTATLQ